VKAGIITYDFCPFIGGQGRCVYEVCGKLRGCPGLDLIVFSPPLNDLPGHVNAAGLSRTIGRNLAFSLYVNGKVNRWIRRYALDLVHFQGGPGGVFLLRRLNIPAAYTAHHTYYQQSHLVAGQTWRRVFCNVERVGYQRADSVICVSSATRNTLVDNYLVHLGKVRVIT
jgi:glycosyltransferase involved in cell wall biosynthesis